MHYDHIWTDSSGCIFWLGVASHDFKVFSFFFWEDLSAVFQNPEPIKALNPHENAVCMKRSCSWSWIFCELYLWWHSDLTSMSFICHNPGCSGLQPNKYKTGCDHIGQAWQECAIMKFCSCEIRLWDHISTDPGVWWTSADKVWRYWIWILPQCCSHYCGAYHEIGSPWCIQHQSLFPGNLLLISLYQYNGPFHFYSAHSQPLPCVYLCSVGPGIKMGTIWCAASTIWYLELLNSVRDTVITFLPACSCFIAFCVRWTKDLWPRWLMW